MHAEIMATALFPTKQKGGSKVAPKQRRSAFYVPVCCASGILFRRLSILRAICSFKLSLRLKKVFALESETVQCFRRT